MIRCRQPMPAATFGGATVNAVFLPGSCVDSQYTIVNATGGVSWPAAR
jgi:hypothetical protein